MRATISFEAGVDKVNNIMRSLVLEETHTLEEALNCMEGATSDKLIEGIDEALGHIHDVASQLEQYRDMLASFERARFETMLPQPAKDMSPLSKGQIIQNLGELKEAIANMKKFDNFVETINETEDQEITNDSQPEEG